MRKRVWLFDLDNESAHGLVAAQANLPKAG
jgi:hypothetical protein